MRRTCVAAVWGWAVLAVPGLAQDAFRPPGAVGAPPQLHAPRSVAATEPLRVHPGNAVEPETTGAIGATPRPQPGLALSGVAALPADYLPETGPEKPLAAHLRPQVVAYPSHEPVGTIVVDTPNTYLYLILGDNRAIRYGVGVGRDGFTWSGMQIVKRAAEWPDWRPPPEMIQRQPYLPRFMAGGATNPLGARALYLGDTVYRIHGTNQPSTIGTFVSSGCIRLLNEDIADLYERVGVGTRVVVLPGNPATIEALLQRR